jgi:FtsH-binding integral membrane protein
MKLNSLSQAAREKRLKAFVSSDSIISLRAYNAILTGTVAYGLLINVLMCRSSIADFVLRSMNPIVFFVGYAFSAFIGIFIAQRSSNALVSFIGYNLVVLPMGITVSLAVNVGGFDPSVVWHAVITTAGVTVIMVAAGLLFPQFFAKLGSILFFGLIGVVIGVILSFFVRGVNLPVTVISAGLFSLYIGYDVYRSQQFPRTVDNAVDCAIDIYLDIINLFLDLLRIFGKSNDS